MRYNSTFIFELENSVYKVKQLTEERENLTVDFKEENDELKNKIKVLERELTNKLQQQQQFNNNKIDKHSHIDTMSSLSDGNLVLNMSTGKIKILYLIWMFLII